MSTLRNTRLRELVRLLGTSRHSALPALRERTQARRYVWGTRSIALLIGSTLIGAAVALLVQADLGLPPYDVLSSGVQDHLGVSLGQAGWLVAGVLFAVATLLGQRPSGWGIAYIVANGLAVDAMSGLLNAPESIVGQVGFVVAGIVVMAVGVNVVLFSGTTGGPFELLMTAGEARGIARLKTRYALDVGVLVLGLVLGGAFGVATILYAALMGLALQAINQMFTDFGVGRSVRLSTNELESEIYSQAVTPQRETQR